MNADVIQSLNETEQHFSVSFLEKVILEDASQAISDLDTKDIKVVAKLLALFDDTLIKDRIINRLAPDIQTALIDGFSAPLLFDFFTYASNITLLKSVFLNHTKNTQTQLLEHLQTERPPIFAMLKDTRANIGTTVGSLTITRSDANEKKRAYDLNKSLNLLLDPASKLTQVQHYAKSLISEYTLKELEALVYDIIQQFDREKIGLRSKETLLIHVKFQFFIHPFWDVLETLDLQMRKTLDTIIIGISELPDLNWKSKVLTQFPKSCVRELIKLMSLGTQLASLEKRNRYSKLLKDLQNLPGKNESTRWIKSVLETAQSKGH